MQSNAGAFMMLLGATTLALIILLNGYCTLRMYRILHFAPSVRNYTYIGDDFPPELPVSLEADDVVLNFRDLHYEITVDADWASLVLPNRGSVRLGPHGREFSVGMYHQLHCLDSIRIAYLATHARPSPSSPANFAEAESCFDTLRQTVLCISDLTLDPAIVLLEKDGSTSSATTATGVDHKCRDWTRVRAAAKGNYTALSTYKSIYGDQCIDAQHDHLHI